MYIFLSIWFLLLPFLNKLLKENNYKKVNLINYLFLFFGSFQVLLSPLHINHSIDFNNFAIVVWILTALLIVFLPCFFTYLLFKKKITINKKILFSAFKKSCITYIVLLIYLIVLLFMKNIYMDTTYYMNISGFFRNDIYSGTGEGALSTSYSFSSIYFVYSVYSSNFQSLYIFLNNIIYTTLIVYVIDDFFNNIFTKSFILIACLPIIIIWSYSTTGGNIIMQASIIIVLLYLLCNKEYYGCFIFLWFLQCFSITGLLLSLVAIPSLLIFMFFTAKRKDLFISCPLSALSFLSMFFIFILKIMKFEQTYNNNGEFVLPVVLTIIGCLILMSTFLIQFKYKKDVKVINWDFRQKKVIWSLTIVFGIIALISMILWGVVYVRMIKFEPNFLPWLAFISAPILIALLIINLVSFIKNKKIVKEFYLLNLFNLFSLMGLIFVMILLPDNQSVWRLSYLNIGCGTLTDIFISICIIMSMLISNIKLKNFNFMYDLKRKHNVIAKLWVIFPLIFTIIASVLSITMQPYYYKNIVAIDTNIQKNINVFSQKEIKLIESLNVNQDTQIITNLRSINFIGKGKDISGKYFGISSWIVNSYGFQSAEKISKKSIDVSAMIQLLNTDDYLIIGEYEKDFYNQFRSSSLLKEVGISESFTVLQKI